MSDLEASKGEPLGAQASRPHPLSPHKGWHSRGYLPHFDQPCLIQSITFRLHDCVPRDVVEHWKGELGWRVGLPANDSRAVAFRRRLDRYEDAGHGQCWLGRDEIAEIVENAILHFDGQRYRLLAWCIMPNHVHVICECLEGHPLDAMVHSWKSFTGKKANRVLGRSGAFWMEDYHDRFIRDDDHLARAVAYVEGNPVKAGLVATKEEWRWSSAGERAGETPAVPGCGSAHVQT
jgi:REP element-mobilizing transposase RayT